MKYSKDNKNIYQGNIYLSGGRIPITPANLLIPENVDVEYIKKQVKSIRAECDEVQDALNKYIIEPTLKHREQLAEEMVDVMTAAGTGVAALEAMEDSPIDFACDVVSKVYYKDKARGYHNIEVGSKVGCIK